MRTDIRDTKIIFDEFLKVEKSRLRWEQFDGSMGGERVRYAVRRGDSVGIVANCERCGKVVLVKQFRYPAVRREDDGYLWEVPAGMIDDGEAPEQTAARELMEETGEHARNLQPLFSMYLSPGLLDEKIHLFRCSITDCSGLAETGGNHLEHENLLIGSFSRKDVLRMAGNGTIRDAKTIAALMAFFIYEDEDGTGA